MGRRKQMKDVGIEKKKNKQGKKMVGADNENVGNERKGLIEFYL